VLVAFNLGYSVKQHYKNHTFEYRNPLGDFFPLDAFPNLAFWSGEKWASARGGNQRMGLL